MLFDYLLTGKPVGLTFEDIDAYAKQPGFAIDPQPLRESAALFFCFLRTAQWGWQRRWRCTG